MKRKADDLELVTLSKAAEMLGVAPSTLRVQIRNGRFDAMKLGRDWLVLKSEIKRYREASKR